MQDGAIESVYDLTWNTHQKLREASEKKLSQKVGKVHNSLNLGKIGNSMTLDLIWERFENMLKAELDQAQLKLELGFTSTKI